MKDFNNDTQDLWFKRKTYGWGWTPINVKGWMVTILYGVLVLVFALTIDENTTSREIVFTFVLPVILLTITLMRICYKKGEKPKWSWGKEKYE